MSGWTSKGSKDCMYEKVYGVQKGSSAARRQNTAKQLLEGMNNIGELTAEKK